MKLKGQHNQCGQCGEYFNSNTAFDKHRTGPHGKHRRCRTPEEMMGKGMLKNAGGWWIASIRTRGIKNA